MLIYSGVFDRHPDLKVVCVESDAGWAPHYAYRMDHIYKRHRFWILSKLGKSDERLRTRTQSILERENPEPTQ
jgi:predicted TIM-barrel fold metal-dependent hydrolase